MNSHHREPNAANSMIVKDVKFLQKMLQRNKVKKTTLMSSHFFEFHQYFLVNF